MGDNKKDDSIFAWIFRLVKGAIIGTGFIIPGVSGGVFAAIFGVYERMIGFFANIRKDFWKNVKFFIPIGIGALISIIVVSKALGEFLKVAEVPLVWFFIGCVLGTLPLLYKQAGKKGRKPKHFIILGITLVATVLFLYFIQGILKNVTIPTDNNIFTWVLCGALMGLGAIVPGLSPSNFLIYMGIYGIMMERMGGLDLFVIIPVIAGAFLCFLLLSKAFDTLFNKAYTGMYHFILGIIIASTIMIIPFNGKALESSEGIVSYTLSLIFICIGTCIAGIALGYIMGILEKKYKTE